MILIGNARVPNQYASEKKERGRQRATERERDREGEEERRQ